MTQPNAARVHQAGRSTSKLHLQVWLICRSHVMRYHHSRFPVWMKSSLATTVPPYERRPEQEHVNPGELISGLRPTSTCTFGQDAQGRFIHRQALCLSGWDTLFLQSTSNWFTSSEHGFWDDRRAKGCVCATSLIMQPLCTFSCYCSNSKTSTSGAM